MLDEELLHGFVQRCQVVIGRLYDTNAEGLAQAIRLLSQQIPPISSFRAQLVLIGLLTLIVKRSRPLVTVAPGKENDVTAALDDLLKTGLANLSLRDARLTTHKPNSPLGLDPRVTGVLKLVEQRYSEPRLAAPDVAHTLGISAEHLCRLLKHNTGRGFGAHLRERRVREAQSQLRETTFSVKEIAARVGYGSTRQLDRHFLKFCGLTPLSYRRSKWQVGQQMATKIKK